MAAPQQPSGWAAALQGYRSARAKYPGFGDRKKRAPSIKTMYAKRQPAPGAPKRKSKPIPEY